MHLCTFKHLYKTETNNFSLSNRIISRSYFKYENFPCQGFCEKILTFAISATTECLIGIGCHYLQFF
ncbi:hypothetical protein T07_14002 [Trichinella nelsoni]|uniref:Uncharacterized protein n=1 Tax=Trichinella nelsoni TaxID=6336 RepID=A0A0V0S0K1_9BILA|nr:hypothetical protein T07_14002 [Trichinella nelsoni]